MLPDYFVTYLPGCSDIRPSPRELGQCGKVPFAPGAIGNSPEQSEKICGFEIVRRCWLPLACDITNPGVLSGKFCALLICPFHRCYLNASHVWTREAREGTDGTARRRPLGQARREALPSICPSLLG